MSITENSSQKQGKKLLETAPGGNLVVPIAIVLVGALIIFGVTKMLSTERSYQDLVREMHSKTFGNRWVAAYELSKLISAKKIPKQDIPWLVTNLNEVYAKTTGPRTKEFVVVALGALKSPLALPTLMDALKEGDDKVKFHVLAALGNFDQELNGMNWDDVLSFLESDDQGLVQASIFVLATHKVSKAKNKLIGFLSSSNQVYKYSAATGLVYYKEKAAIETLKEILMLEARRGDAQNYTVEQVAQLKLNILRAVEKEKWTQLNETLQTISEQEKNLKVVSKARSVLNQLKN